MDPRRSLAAAVGLVAALCVPGCGQKGGGELHARRVVLEREVEGLREIAARMDRGEPVLPVEDVVVGISDTTVQAMIAPQLPFEAEASGFAVTMNEAELTFRGAPGITLRGTLHHADHPDLEGEVEAIGTLDDIAVDPKSATLHARVVIDHLDLVRMAGLERYVTSGTVDELARTLRHAFEGRIPDVQIPVRVEQAIDFPSVTEGPVRLQGATLPLAVSVSDVFAGTGILWIAVHVEPGAITRQGPPPADVEVPEIETDVDVAAVEAPPGGRPSGSGRVR